MSICIKIQIDNKIQNTKILSAVFEDKNLGSCELHLFERSGDVLQLEDGMLRIQSMACYLNEHLCELK